MDKAFIGKIGKIGKVPHMPPTQAPRTRTWSLLYTCNLQIPQHTDCRITSEMRE